MKEKVKDFFNQIKPKTKKSWIFFWVGIITLIIVAVLFFWTVKTVVAEDGEVTNDKSKVSQQSTYVQTESEATNQPMLKSVSFMSKSKSADINWTLIIVIILAVSFIGYAIYKNKDNSV
jgi:uncharacterized integral membrane protein